ncbi:DNA recombination protein RmuC [Metamycoplasma auris]|uniref:DNA recombination protein RmuC n=1 Tax=Metamycoplasma auris TaxID=51363 RepID=A0A2W7G8S3_9BACT|nr:DNA recombination protein RmuC [Metamycoplasma auris]PZW01445.1 DNA recombination protein RmuC [Metamycoplasma auris]
MIIGILIINIVILLTLIVSLIYIGFKSKLSKNQLNNELKKEFKNINEETTKELKSELNSILLSAITGSNDNSLYNILNKSQIELGNSFFKLEKEIRETIDNKLNQISERNTKEIGNIKDKIDSYFNDKLEKQVANQFKAIQDSMDKMSTGMIEFSTIQESVMNLSKTFSNPKTIGNFGEFTLESILRNQFPTLENKYWFKQYSIGENSSERVDFAIKSVYLEDGFEKEIFIPIDCKFPSKKWSEYIDNKIQYKEIENEIKTMAKSIKGKYIKENKKTMPFGILYLPAESIYLKVIEDFNFVSEIFKDLQVLIQGPSTIMAFIYNILIKNQGFMFSKHLEEIKDLFIYIQKNYKNLSNSLSESEKNVNKASESISKATKNANLVMDKLNNQAKKLNIDKLEYKKSSNDNTLIEE